MSLCSVDMSKTLSKANYQSCEEFEAIITDSSNGLTSKHTLEFSPSSFPRRGRTRTATLTEQPASLLVSAKKPFGFGGVSSSVLSSS